MRHLYGTALASIMTVVMFFGGAWGYLRLLRLPAPAGQPAALPAGGGSLLGNSAVFLALAAVVVTGVMAGLLVAVPRISPLAAGLPGLLLIAWTGLYLTSVRRATEIIPFRSQAFGAGWEALLFNGVLGTVGFAMIIPMFLPSRWRGTRAAEDSDLEAITRDSDQFLAGLMTDAPSRRRRPAPGQQGPRQPGSGRPAARRPASELTGTVIPRSTGANPAISARRDPGAPPVDTTRVTGASRALRATGPLRAASGPPRTATGPLPPARQPRAARPNTVTGPFRQADGGPPPSSARPRPATGSFRAADSRLPERPDPAGNA